MSKQKQIDGLIRAGRGMANVLYNITQMNVLNPRHAESARESFREWDQVLIEYRRVSGKLAKPKKAVS